MLSLLPGLTSLHLQHNKLRCIEALAALPNLRLLCAAHNQIQQVGVHSSNWHCWHS